MLHLGGGEDGFEVIVLALLVWPSLHLFLHLDVREVEGVHRWEDGCDKGSVVGGCFDEVNP